MSPDQLVVRDLAPVTVRGQAEALVGRPTLRFKLHTLNGARVLVTGADGFLGQRLCSLLTDLGGDVEATDLPQGDLLSDSFRQWLAIHDRFSYCFHLAAHKYAELGEERPASVADLNVRGTARLVELMGDRVIFASTCKAADPATVYGASKLIAERIVLNAGGRVLRLVNVLGSSGSVLEIWKQIPETEPLPVTACKRMWITPDEAVEALVATAFRKPGRYAPGVPPPEPVSRLAERAFPNRRRSMVPLRKGDRPVERVAAEGEGLSEVDDGLRQIVGVYGW